MNLALHKLKENFSWQVKYWLVLLAITIVIDLSAIGTYSKEIQHLPLVSQDSLLLRNNNGQRTFTVEKGQEVKIWLNGRTDRGAFLKLENDMMSISKKGTIIKYNVLDISKIKVFGNLETKVIGYGFKIWGALIIFAGIMVPFSWGPAGLFISVPAWAAGFGIYKFGELISGTRRFDLKKKWQITKQSALGKWY